MPRSILSWTLTVTGTVILLALRCSAATPRPKHGAASASEIMRRESRDGGAAALEVSSRGDFQDEEDLRPLRGPILATEYTAVPADPIDRHVAWYASQLPAELQYKVLIERLGPGEYSINGQRCHLRWHGNGEADSGRQQREVLVSTETADQDWQRVPQTEELRTFLQKVGLGKYVVDVKPVVQLAADDSTGYLDDVAPTTHTAHARDGANSALERTQSTSSSSQQPAAGEDKVGGSPPSDPAQDAVDTQAENALRNLNAEPLPLQAGWKEYRDKDDKPFWYREDNKITTYTRPVHPAYAAPDAVDVEEPAKERHPFHKRDVPYQGFLERLLHFVEQREADNSTNDRDVTRLLVDRNGQSLQMKKMRYRRNETEVDEAALARWKLAEKERISAAPAWANEQAWDVRGNVNVPPAPAPAPFDPGLLSSPGPAGSPNPTTDRTGTACYIRERADACMARDWYGDEKNAYTDPSMPSRVLEFLKFDTESTVGQLITSKPDCLWSMKEAKEYIRSAFGECYDTSDESKILEYIDANGSGMISVIEFKDFQLELKREVELQHGVGRTAYERPNCKRMAELLVLFTDKTCKCWCPEWVWSDAGRDR